MLLFQIYDCLDLKKNSIRSSKVLKQSNSSFQPLVTDDPIRTNSGSGDGDSSQLLPDRSVRHFHLSFVFSV